MQKCLKFFLSHRRADALRSLQPGADVVANGVIVAIDDINVLSTTGNVVTLFSGRGGEYGFTLIESVLPGTHQEGDVHEFRMHHDPFALRSFLLSFLRGFNREIDLTSFEIASS